MKKYVFSGIFVAILGAFALGCASMTPISRETQANMVLTQIQATLETADVLYAELSKDGQSPEALRVTKVVLLAMKPQIVSWITLIEQLKASDEQYAQALVLKDKLQVVDVKLSNL